jgi:hypothetical protein
MTFEEILPYLKKGWTCACKSKGLESYRYVYGKLFINGWRANEFPAHLTLAEDWFIVIDINQSHKTANGLRVRLYASDGSKDWPIHGAVLFSGEWVLAAWNVDGVCCGQPDWKIAL